MREYCSIVWALFTASFVFMLVHFVVTMIAVAANRKMLFWSHVVGGVAFGIWIGGVARVRAQLLWLDDYRFLSVAAVVGGLYCVTSALDRNMRNSRASDQPQAIKGSAVALPLGMMSLLVTVCIHPRNMPEPALDLFVRFGYLGQKIGESTILCVVGFVASIPLAIMGTLMLTGSLAALAMLPVALAARRRDRREEDGK